MYTVISAHCGIRPWCLYRRAIWAGFLSRCEKTLKHSARFSLHVIEGLKVITPFLLFHLAISMFL